MYPFGQVGVEYRFICISSEHMLHCNHVMMYDACYLRNYVYTFSQYCILC